MSFVRRRENSIIDNYKSWEARINSYSDMSKRAILTLILIILALGMQPLQVVADENSDNENLTDKEETNRGFCSCCNRNSLDCCWIQNCKGNME